VILIPPDRLDTDLLVALIEEFILQEGTDYGVHESALANKVSQVRRQIDKGDVLITYDEESESCNLMTKGEYKRFASAEES
jgi:uncharacterized protein YheU (UPF0270 family)